MPTPKSRLKNKLNPKSKKTKLNGNGSRQSLSDPPIGPDRIASLLGVSRRKEASLHAQRAGPPCWLLGKSRVSTVGTVEQWIAQQAHNATLDALNNFGKHHHPKPRRRRAA